MKKIVILEILLCCVSRSIVLYANEVSSANDTMSANFSTKNALDSNEDFGVNDCCSRGEKFARQGARNEEECNVNQPPADVEPENVELCVSSYAACCKEYFKQSENCEAGVKLATNKQCANANADIGKTCCEECSAGLLSGKSLGKEACGAPVDEDISLSFTLSKEAFRKCCQEAANAVSTTIATTPATTTETITDPCKNSPCEHICQNENGEAQCLCKAGYKLAQDGTSCIDINECADSDANLCTGDSMVCHNTPGSYKCVPLKKRETRLSCPPGFKMNLQNKVCDDINECQLPRPPCPKYLCQNTIGAYKCAGKLEKPVTVEVTGTVTSPAGPTTTPAAKDDMCPPGFRAGPDDECVDIDECEEQSDDCQRLSQHCINTHGSFFCQDHVSKRCAPGFKVNSATGICEDIDECEESNELCKRNEVCVNLPGAYNCKSKISTLPRLATKKCQEGTRLRPGATICEDIDECREGTHLCDQFQNCINTFGAHECRCKNGFELDSTGSCIDIDECDMKLDACPPGTYCLNVLGSYTCTRKPVTIGTTLPPYEYEEYSDYGDDSTNDTSVTPVEPPTTPKAPSTTTTRRTTTRRYSPVTPRATTPITTTNTRRLNPVTRPTTTNRPAIVTRTSTTSRLFTTSKPTTTSTSTTTSTTTTPTTTIRTTTTTSRPPTTSRITTTSTTTTTSRPPFISRAPTASRSTTSRPRRPYRPEPNVNRPNTDRPINLTTERTYEPTSTDRARTDSRPFYPNVITTPKSNTERNVDRESTATETDTHFNPNLLYCLDGFERDENGNCVDRARTDSRPFYPNVITTPKSNTERNGDRESTATETDTHFNPNLLYCLDGFERDENGNCVDIDECRRNRYVCGSSEVCKNFPGGYICDCAPGYQRDETGWCIPLVVRTTPATTTSTTTITTTSSTTSTTTPAPRAPNTTSREGTYVTSPDRTYTPPSAPWPYSPSQPCELGYRFDALRKTCVDIDECALGRSNCDADERCINVDGGYRCVCAKQRCLPGSEGYTPSYVIPPSTANAQANVITVGTQYGHRGPKYLMPNYSRVHSGAVMATCSWGYRLSHDKRCLDLDECTSGAAVCGPEQRCENFYGGYSCQCPAGHRLDEDRCIDVNECEIAQPCSMNGQCINTVGSYRCECGPGFRNAPANDKVCVDIDECAERPGMCQHRCINSWGGYRCTCNKGYRLHSDNRTCIDIDECKEWNSRRGRLCVGNCVNVEGSFRCQCPDGYRLSEDGRSCVDIDECEIGTARCANGNPSVVCQNTRGGYHCHEITCPQGYRLEHKHRCVRIQRSCPYSDWQCLRRPGTYSYNFITFVSNLYLPSGSVDLFTMHGPSWSDSSTHFELDVAGVRAPPGVKPADISCFDVRSSGSSCAVSLRCSLQGPQVAELELTMTLHRREQYAGSAVAKLVLIVSEYDF